MTSNQNQAISGTISHWDVTVFMKKSRKRSGFVVYSYFKDSEFTSAIQMDGKF